MNIKIKFNYFFLQHHFNQQVLLSRFLITNMIHITLIIIIQVCLFNPFLNYLYNKYDPHYTYNNNPGLFIYLYFLLFVKKKIYTILTTT